MATTASAAPSPAIPSRRFIPPTRVLLALDGSGNGTDAVTFSPAFDNAPPSLAFSLSKPLGVNGTISAASITKSGFTLTMSGCSDLASANCECVLSVHEPL